MTASARTLLELAVGNVVAGANLAHSLYDLLPGGPLLGPVVREQLMEALHKLAAVVRANAADCPLCHARHG